MSSITLLGTVTLAAPGSNYQNGVKFYNAGSVLFRLSDGIVRRCSLGNDPVSYSIDTYVQGIVPPVANYKHIFGIALTGFWWVTTQSKYLSNRTLSKQGKFHYNNDGSIPTDIISQINSVIDDYTQSFGYGTFPLTGSIYGFNTDFNNPPCYRDLVGGYGLDNRSIPNNPWIVPTETKQITIKYYKENKLEQIPNLKSICWMVYKCDLVKGQKYYLPIEDCVLGTLYCSSSDVKNLISSMTSESGDYEWSDLLPESIPSLFSNWQSICDTANIHPVDSFTFPETRILRKIAANNDVWNNATLGEDINPDPEHPMFKVDRDRAYQWHLVPVDNGVGNLVMEGPHTMEIHAALNAGVYSKNPSTGDARVANLGHLLEKLAAICGYRPEPDGTLNHDKEKANVRTVISKDKAVDKTKLGVTSFGEDGMVVRRLNNSSSGGEVTDNERVVVKDLLQLLAEYQDQLNLALGLQESSTISVQTENGTAKYANQLAALVEILNLSIVNHDLIRSTLVSSMVAQGQTTELIAGMGLPSVTKTIPVKIDGKISDLPYQGIAAHRSISQEIAVCTQNVGIVTGQLL
jgi:hypothetical protein